MKPFNVEVWASIKGYEGLYEISTTGRVRGLDRLRSNGKRQPGKILSPGKAKNGYLFVNLWKNGGEQNVSCT